MQRPAPKHAGRPQRSQGAADCAGTIPRFSLSRLLLRIRCPRELKQLFYVEYEYDGHGKILCRCFLNIGTVQGVKRTRPATTFARLANDA